MNTADLQQLLAERLSALGVERNTVLLCAVSGGADSTALALALHGTGRYRLELVWVRHGLQEPEFQQAEEDRVRSLAERLGLVLHRSDLGAGTVARRAADAGVGIEAAARELRYGAFVEVARDCPGDDPVDIVTAHHQADQAETFLMRAAAGHSAAESMRIPELREVSGARDPRRIRVLRPLLTVAPGDLRAFLNDQGVAWHEDPGNEGAVGLRSRLRGRVMPNLEAVVPGAVHALSRFADSQEQMREALNWFLNREAPGIRQGDTSWEIPRQQLEALPRMAREMLLRRVAYRISRTPRLDAAGIRSVLVALEAGSELHVHQSAAAGLRLQLDASMLHVSAHVVRSGQSGYLFAVEPGTLIQHDTLSGVWSPAEAEYATPTAASLRGWRPPALLREPRAGDRMVLAGRGRTPGAGRPENTGWPQAVIEDAAGLLAYLWHDGKVVCRDGCSLQPAGSGSHDMIRLVRGQ